MPYINPKYRATYTPSFNTASMPGELNYQIIVLVDAYIKDHGLSYGTLNEVIGVIGCANMEVYRRMGAPYEDKKLAENGDVFSIKE
jgi:hypothetical protein